MNLNRLLLVVVPGVLVAGVLSWGSSPVVAMWQEASSSELPYQFVDSGGVSLSTAGNAGETPTVTYTRIQPGAVGTTPAGFGIFGFRNSDGVLLTETTVPAVGLIQEGRTYAEYFAGAFNTAIALVNPNDQETTINFFFTDAFRDEGDRDFGAGVLTLEPNAQMARFISEEPFNFESGVRATMTFTSSLPVAAIAVIEFISFRGEALYSTLPVTDISGPQSTDTVFLPHFAESGGWSTDFILINPSDEPITGLLGFVSNGVLHPDNPVWDDPGLSTPVALNGSISQPVYPYRVEAKAQFLYRTFGGLFLKTGSARALPNPDDGSVSPIIQVVFSRLDAVTLTPITRAAFSGTSSGTAFRMYAETLGEPGAIGSIRSGFAIHNVDFERANVFVSLTDLDGNLVATSLFPVPPSGHRSVFLDEVFDDVTLPNPFKGVFRVATTGNQQIAVIALRSRINDRGEFLITTTPPVNESSTATAFETFFPHLVDGGGWSTQTVLFSGIAGQSANGLLRFFGVDGQPFDIPLQ